MHFNARKQSRERSRLTGNYFLKVHKKGFSIFILVSLQECHSPGSGAVIILVPSNVPEANSIPRRHVKSMCAIADTPLTRRHSKQ